MLIAAAIVNFALFAMLIYRYDLFEKEPWYVLLFCVAISAAMTHAFCYGADFAIENLLWIGSFRFVGALIAGTGEELIKLLAVIVTLSIFRKTFNDPFDGLIYGAFAGLGFALDESWMYNSFDTTSPISIRCAHLFARFLIHTLLGALTCAGLGFWRFQTPRWKLVFVTLTCSAMALHFAYDYAVIGMSEGRLELLPRQQATTVVVMVLLIGLFGRTVVIGSRKSGTIHGKKQRTLVAWPFSVFFRKKNL